MALDSKEPPKPPESPRPPKSESAQNSHQTDKPQQGNSTPEPQPIVQQPSPGQADEKIATYTEQLARFTGQLRIYTGLLALVTAGLILVGLLQHNKMRDTIKTMQNTEIRQLRAYVFVSHWNCLSHFDPAKGSYWWSIAPVWKNSGATPTRGLLVNVTMYLEDHPLPEDWHFPSGSKNYDTLDLLGPGGTMQGAEIHISDDALIAFQEGKRYFYIWGWAKYRDVFPGTPERVTKFCKSVSFRGTLTEPVSDKNVVEWIFPTYRKHNCADEDCQKQP